MIEGVRRWHEEKEGRILAATIMPDHVHVLFELGNNLCVGQCVGRWKSGAREKMGYREDWQRDFWEHRLRREEAWEDYGLYILLNPYRAALIKKGEAWPWWWVPDPNVFLFTQALDVRGVPPAEWMDWPEKRFSGLQVGE